MSEALTFKVVENYEPVVDYEEFKKDFLDPLVRMSDMKKKYDMPKRYWKMYKDRVCKEEGIKQKPFYIAPFNILKKNFGKKIEIKHGQEFIQYKNNGWIVVKRLDDKTYYFGRYETLECAKKIRDKLWESNWDVELGNYLKNKYGIERAKPAKIKAMKYYSEFEELYIYSDLRVLEICDKLGLTNKMYNHILKRLHEEHGHKARNFIRKDHGVEPIVGKRK